MSHLIEVVQLLGDRGVNLVVLDQAIDTTTPAGRLVFHVIGAIAEFERDLIAERTRDGLAVLQVRDVRREHRAWAGFPDLLIVGPAGIMFRELKQAGGQFRAAQKQWVWRLRGAPQDVAAWRPADWHAGRIAAELGALAVRAGCRPGAYPALPPPIRS